ncbi:Xaa-Pro dipeptidase [Izhakiella australiensis]|uniref:Xaa-Pro dipeptidase n=1 Tax=Izhakiella australiensis TaxID=1926881 RepID=A0A1S8YHR5_9GAMM|nr:Xaa-Pro dipeptidase [Izhakiella australiensis]OON38590.1 Xaa-Pro dipeptidase [Izhakiella australiensis]
MDSLVALYQEHLKILQGRAQQALARMKLDAMLIHSGELLTVFLDDHDYPFKVNPQFKHWVPVTDVANCWLWVDGVNKPKLWFYSPVDYWHNVKPLPQSFWSDEIDIVVLRNADDIARLLPAQRENVAYIGPAVQRASQLGFSADNINPQGLINYLHYYRAYKTNYELACMRQAQKIAVLGHRAAKDAFLAELSEFDINVAYLSATGHRDIDVPYGNIVALNEHAAVLHYTQLEQQAPPQLHSFLLDAGAEYNGYAADITRSYAAQPDSEFAALLADMDREQQALIADLNIGGRYSDYHLQMHQRIARLLIKHDLLKGLSEEALVAEDITGPFMPHGLGHPLGLQVHDVAGFMQDDSGTHMAAPQQYPFLRCTRMLEPGMVLTIEPGIYFIDSLLAPWRESRFSQHFNWSRIEAFKAYGGIRIEDNVVFHDNNRIENMTRDLNLN